MQLIGCMALTGLAGAGDEIPVPGAVPRLVLLIVVDQLGADEMERLDFALRGGIRYLLDHGVSFTRAHHDHAVTDTAPGHASLATGRFPRHHGIIGNWWLEDGAPVKLWAIDDDEVDESPARLLATTLGDWLGDSHADAKVYAASGKDRAAILMGGLSADGAFWFDDEEGGMTTSEYYPESGWLRDFNARGALDDYFGRLWEPLPLDPETIERLQIQELDLRPLRSGLPRLPGRARPAPDEDFYHAMRDSPWLDLYLAEFARFLIEAQELGADDQPDLLALGFSAADYVGHDFGPHSREYVDVLLRLDRTLAELLEFIDQRVGLDRVVVGFTADHGVAPVPEIRQRQGLAGRRVDAEVILCIQQVGQRLAARHGVERWLIPGPMLRPHLDRDTGLSREVLEQRTAEALQQCPAVAKVWTRSELSQEASESERERWVFANGFHVERSPDFMIRFDQYFMPSVESLTTHGSSYPYDTRVPMVLVAPGLEPAVVDTPVRTVDLAPTLAVLAGVPPPADLDGRDLSTLLRAMSTR